MKSLLALVLLAFCASGSNLKEIKKASIIKMSERRGKHIKGTASAHSALALESTASTAETSNSTAVQTATSPETTAEVDGATYTWTVGAWSECSVECGAGVSTREVYCWNSDSSTIDNDSVCQTNQFIANQTKPDTAQQCQGPCIKCDELTNLFLSIGLTAPPAHPVRASTNSVCHVLSSPYSCCDKRVENSIITQVASIQKGFQTVPKSAQDQTASMIDYISNSTAEFSERLEETWTQLNGVRATLAEPSALKMDKQINRALAVVESVLVQRTKDLQTAIQNSTAITSLLTAQLNVLNQDTSQNATSTIPTSSTPNVTSGGRTAQLSDCVQATISLFGSMSCAACSPSFITDYVDTHHDVFSSVNVSTTMCTNVYKQCSPTIRASRNYLRQALQIMRGIHSNLARSAALVEPALLALWSAISFNWLPGAARPLSSQPSSNAQTFLPDITTLDCIKDTQTYVLPPSTQVNDFCSSFYANWNYQLTIKSLLQDVKVGVRAMSSLQQCDKCVHLVVSKLGQILSAGKGGIDVSLSLIPDALSSAGCYGLSSSPRATPTAASLIKQQLSTSVSSAVESTLSSVNFFALSDADSEFSPGERSALARKSRRAIALILAGVQSKRSGLSDALTTADATTITSQNITGSAAYIYKLQYQDNGLDPTALANVSWATVQTASKNPPPSVWATRFSSEVGIIATDINCTSHATCNPESGDMPFWFCATASVCNGTIPCDDAERAMLKSHPKCVKGLCVDGSTAVDGVCPQIAICPTTKSSGQFDHSYFVKFKSIAPITPPSSDLVASEGAVMANAITQALNYATGVCDCAFSRTTDQTGAVVMSVADQCKYAQCLAYASANEAHTTCQSNLLTACNKIISSNSCPNVVCDKSNSLWNAPTCATSANGGFALSDAAMKAAGRTTGLSASWWITVVTAVVSVAIAGLW